MADIRINALATTAASTASDDFVAVDGSANGTRKLSAYSPTFGGNLTVSGIGTIGSGGTGATTGTLLLSGSSANDTGPYITFSRNSVAKGYIGTASGVTGGSSDNLVVYTSALAATFSGANTTLAGNLTVSGGGTNVLNGPSAAITTSGSGVNGTLRLTESPSSGAMLMMGTYGGNYAYVQMTNSSNLAASYPIALNPNGGNVGIGTTSPNAKLEIGLGSISGSEPNQYLRVNASTYNSALSANLDLLNWGNNFNNSLGWRISAINSAGVTTQRDLAFSSLVDAGSGTVGAATERMRLFGNGNLFIGASPVDGGQKLQVSGSAIFGSTNTAQLSNPTAQIIRQQFSASTVGLRLEADSANAQAVIGTSSNHSLHLRSNDTTALTLDSSQNATFAGKVKQGDSSISGISEVFVSTTPVNIATSTSVGGLYFVTGYNTSGGAQGSWLLMTKGTAVTTVSSDNGTGLTVNFSMSSGILQAATASGTVALIATAITRG